MIPLCESGGTKEGLYSQLSKRLDGSPVATVLGTVKNKEDIAEFYKRYFHDFIREVHLATHAESGQEYKVSNLCLMRNNCYYKSINIAFIVGGSLL